MRFHSRVITRDAVLNGPRAVLSPDDDRLSTCTTDVIALGALNFARVSGIDVPSQLSVTGFDGISDASQPKAPSSSRLTLTRASTNVTRGYRAS